MLKGSARYLINNLSVAFLANIVSLFGSTMITLILPKFIGVTQYGYYQLYVFYVSYLGFLGLGWIEGIYLRYGGKYFEELDKPLINKQFRVFSIMETIFGLLILILGLIFCDSLEKERVFILVGFCAISYLPRAFLHNILQATGKIREYAIATIIEKAVHIVLTLSGLMLGMGTFVWFILSELIGRICAAIYIFTICKSLIFSKTESFKVVWKDIKLNITCGIALMFANIASMLIIGIIRQLIEIFWNVETFSKVSLTLSISNLLLTFINSVAVVLFPMLRRSDESKLITIYYKMRNMLMIPLLGMLICYYPIKVFLSLWLPQYTESLKYMAILFPICIYESKMSMLINTYMKTLRKERVLLVINIVTVIFSLCIAIFTCVWLKNLDGAILSIIIVLAFRCILAESVLSKYIQVRIIKDIVLELILVCTFVCCNWFIGGIQGLIVYVILYFIYLFLKRNDVKTTYCAIKIKYNSLYQ